MEKSALPVSVKHYDPYDTINGHLLCFASVTAKHYDACQLVHRSHLIDRYIETLFDKQLMCVNIDSYVLYARFFLFS